MAPLKTHLAPKYFGLAPKVFFLLEPSNNNKKNILFSLYSISANRLPLMLQCIPSKRISEKCFCPKTVMDVKDQ